MYENESVILFILYLCLKQLSVQDPWSIPWVLSPLWDLGSSSAPPAQGEQLDYALLQLSPLRCMMSSCPDKCWEMFHFSLVSKSKAKEVFKYLWEIHLVYAIYFTHNICKFRVFFFFFYQRHKAYYLVNFKPGVTPSNQIQDLIIILSSSEIFPRDRYWKQPAHIAQSSKILIPSQKLYNRVRPEKVAVVALSLPWSLEQDWLQQRTAYSFLHCSCSCCILFQHPTVSL